MRIGLGLGVTRLGGGDPVDRALAGFKHIYDARKGATFTDYGTGDADGTASNISHSGNWWSFNGSGSYADLWANGSISLAADASATFVLVLRRTSESNPNVTRVPFSYKDDVVAADRGPRFGLTTAGNLSAIVGDGTTSTTKTTSGVTFTSSAVRVVTLLVASTVELRVDGTLYGTTTRTVADATPNTVGARLGANASALTSPWDGDVGLCAAAQRALSSTEIADLVVAAKATWS
jgi:hypothetical protein